MKGVEAVRSSTPQFIRDSFKELFNICMNGTNQQLIEKIEKIETEFKILPVEDICSPTSASEVNKYTSNGTYVKGTPIHIRGAILYNSILDKLDKNIYDKINDGDKIKYVYLKTPNPIGENVIAFPIKFPDYKNLHEYVDKKTQFEKVFINPLEKITSMIGWKIKDEQNLEDLFG